MTCSISPIISSSSFAVLDNTNKNMITTSPSCAATMTMPLPLLPSSASAAAAAAKLSPSSLISRRAYWPTPVTARPSNNACDCELSSFKSSHSRNWIVSAAVEVNNLSSSPSTSSPEDNIGSRVRVKVPLKVYHVPKVPEVDLTGLEGQIKQYVGLWKGKRISANLPYKVEFVTEIPGRGPVKFFAHLKEDEFEYI